MGGKYKRRVPATASPWYPRHAVAKRSPILGYNHNVRYRGLIFHVQTEDSGLLSPHLFTHLFYEGVIISTRKLVYDAGSDEGAIKSLMQAQHKAVMKDLKRGAFDEKMETNLAGHAGLLPRGVKETAESDPLRESQPSIPDPQEILTEPGIEIIRDEPSAPIRKSEPVLPPPIRAGTEPFEIADAGVTQPIEVLEELLPPPPAVISRTATPPPIPAAARAKTPAPIMIQPRNSPARADTEPQTPRTKTAEKRPTTLPPPPSDDLDPPTLAEDPATLAAQMFATSSSARPWTQESAPEIEIVPEDPPRRRATRDTDIESPSLMVIEDAPRVSDGVPSQIAAPRSDRASQPPPVPPLPGQRAPFSAATLPPSRPVTRPPSRPMPPMVRPVESQPPRQRNESDAVEVYAPAPGSADPPPGLERPGQYAQHKRNSKQFATPEPVPRERSSSAQIPTRAGSGSAPIPAGLGRPVRPSEQNRSVGVPRPVPRDPTPAPPMSSGIPQSTAPSHTLPRGKPPTPSRDHRLPTPGRTPTPPRIQSTQPLMRPNAGSGGVVMTRPAVIVGAPPKTTTQRVRKAREEEGRGFGQGLISEKSLDEVILAYLSEDADDK